LLFFINRLVPSLFNENHLFVTVLLEWTQKHDSDRSNKDDCLWLKTGWVKTRRSVQKANKSKKGRGRESEVRAGRSGIYTNNAGELGMKTQDNLAEDKRK